MPIRDRIPAGEPCWIDLASSDTARSADFYGRLFGWTAEEPNNEFGGYFNFTKDGRRIAGCMQRMDDQPEVWSVYLAVDDAATVVAEVERRGLPVMVPASPVADLGSMAFVADAGGAMVGMWQAGTHKGMGITGEPGTPGWFELHTRDFTATLDFYRDVFGWDVHVMSDTPEFRYATLGEGEGQAAGIMDASGFLPEGVPAHWSVYFSVASADETIAAATALGGSVVMPAEDTPYGRLAVLADPLGAMFKLVQPG